MKVSGVVTDNDGVPLPGVNVQIDGNDMGTITDIDGRYTLQTMDGNADLIFSFIGMATKRINIANQSTINVTLGTDSQILDEIFVTATSKPIRRIEAVTAVEQISSREIERMNPTSLIDLVRFTPGIYVQTQAGRVRNFIFTRGFPDATNNGLVYTALMMDGVRTFASPEMVPDGGFRNDLNVDKVEVVRGSAATLYGRGSAAGAINVISKTGGTETHGMVKGTFGQYNWLQIDANVNGPLNAAKTLRYNIGGFYLKDDGFRENLFPDQGGQLRANIDYLFNEDKGSLRVYGGVIDLIVQNMISIPYAANDLTKPAGNWNTRMIELKEGNPFEGSSWPITNPASGETSDNEYEPGYSDGNFSRGANAGINLDYEIADGLRISNKLRWQKMTVGIGFDFSTGKSFADPTFGATQTKLLFGGGGTNGGSDSKELAEELRISKTFDTGNASHTITAGGFYSTINVLVESAGTVYTQDTSDPDNPTYNREPFGFPFNLNFRNGDYTESTTSGFIGYEGKFNDKFTFNAGFRADKINLDLTDNYQAGQENLNHVEDHSGNSFSVGANYLLSPLSAVYGNFLSSFRAPDYSSYTPVRYLANTETIDKPRVEENEKINSFELGYRVSTGDFSFDGGLFNTLISNRTVASFVGAIATQVPVGDNRITGAEISGIYTPQNTPGLYLRTSVTIQTTEYTDYVRSSPDGEVDLSGNKIANVPPVIFNLSAGYSNEKFSVNLNNNFLGARSVDVYNTADYPSRLLVDANASYNITPEIRFKVGGQNLTNVTHAASVVSAQTDNAFYIAESNGYAGDFANVRGVPLLPRRLYASVDYKF